MGTQVTAKFYRILRPDAAAPSPEDVFRNLIGLQLAAREIDTGEDVVIRMERMEQEATYLTGEFCRIQKTNIPPSAGPDGLTPTVLENGKGLGHLAAFRYHLPTNLILLQMNQQCGPRRIELYMGLSKAKPFYHLDPVLRSDAFGKLARNEVKAFKARFAQPNNLKALDDKTRSALSGVKKAAKFFNANEIEIVIKAGVKKQKKETPHLFQLPTKRILRKLSRSRAVDSLEAQVNGEWVDLLEQHMKVIDQLELRSDNTEENYAMRKEYLAKEFNANIEELKKMFGFNDGGN